MQCSNTLYCVILCSTIEAHSLKKFCIYLWDVLWSFATQCTACSDILWIHFWNLLSLFESVCMFLCATFVNCMNSYIPGGDLSLPEGSDLAIDRSFKKVMMLTQICIIILSEHKINVLQLVSLMIWNILKPVGWMKDSNHMGIHRNVKDLEKCIKEWFRIRYKGLQPAMRGSVFF